MALKDVVTDIFKATSRSAVSGAWEKAAPTGVFENGAMVECSMLSPQRELYGEHKDASHLIVSQPPGTGKSTAVKFCHIEDVISNPQRRLVIAVPLEGIAKTFGDVNLVLDDGSTVRWSPRVNLCRPTNGESKADLLVDFLTRTDFTKDYGERICICTYDSLEAANKRLKGKTKGERCKLFGNVTLVVDEGHHVLNTSHTAYREDNLLGELIEFLVSNHGKIENSKVWLTTATYVRGDCMEILSVKNLFLFKRYSLPLDRHWRENFRYIRDYSYGFVNYPSVQGPFDAIEKILTEHKLPTIIYVPKQGSVQAQWCSNGCKLIYRDKIIEAIKRAWPTARILDLVGTDGREDRKQNILMTESELEQVDVILTISMMDEGIDWPKAAQILDLAPSNSLRIAVQRFGRLLRDVPGKKHVYYYSFMQSSLDQILDPEGYRRDLNEAHAALTASLLIEEMIQPVKVVPKIAGSKPDPDDESEFVNWFLEEVPDDGKRAKILENIETGLLMQKGRIDSDGEGVFGVKDAKKIVYAVLRRAKVEHVDEIARQIVAMFRRRTLAYGKGMEWAVDAGFEELYDDSILDNLLGVVGKGCGLRTFAAYYKAKKTKESTWDDNVLYLNRFYEKHHRLPSVYSKDKEERRVANWLRRNLRDKDLVELAKRDGKL